MTPPAGSTTPRPSRSSQTLAGMTAMAAAPLTLRIDAAAGGATCGRQLSGTGHRSEYGRRAGTCATWARAAVAGGFTLIESLIASVVLAIAVVAVSGAIMAAKKQ